MDLQNRALVRYTLACQVIMYLAALAAHARVFLKSGRRLPRFLVFVERFLNGSLIYASSKLRQSFMCHFICMEENYSRLFSRTRNSVVTFPAPFFVLTHTQQCGTYPCTVLYYCAGVLT